MNGVTTEGKDISTAANDAVGNLDKGAVVGAAIGGGLGKAFVDSALAGVDPTLAQTLIAVAADGAITGVGEIIGDSSTGDAGIIQDDESSQQPIEEKKG